MRATSSARTGSWPRAGLRDSSGKALGMAGHPLPAKLVEAFGEARRIPRLEVVADADEADLRVPDAGVLAVIGGERDSPLPVQVVGQGGTDDEAAHVPGGL